MNIPYGDETFDVVVLNHVYEHIPDAGRAFDEVWRILRPAIVVASPNRLAAIEPHHKLLGLSWLPDALPTSTSVRPARVTAITNVRARFAGSSG